VASYGNTRRAAARRSIEFGGRTWRISLDAKAFGRRVEAWLKGREVAAGESNPALTDGERAQVLAQVRRDAAAGLYRAGGRVYRAALGTTEGALAFVRGVLLDDAADATDEEVAGLIAARCGELQDAVRAIEAGAKRGW
jgi:hypothetical protein